MNKRFGFIIGLSLLFLLVVAAGCGGSSSPGVWSRGRILLIHVPGVEKVDQVAYSVNGEHFVISPSQLTNKLALINATVLNQVSNRVLLILDEKTASIGDTQGNRFPVLDPFKDRTQVASPGPDEGKYLPFLWGDITLEKDFQITAWLVFDVPADAELNVLFWEETESIRARF